MNTNQTWQPIETAPRDGSEFLAFDADTPDEGLFIVFYTPQGANGGRDFEIKIDGQCMLSSHWMPLPQPPLDNHQHDGVE